MSLIHATITDNASNDEIRCNVNFQCKYCIFAENKCAKKGVANPINSNIATDEESVQLYQIQYFNRNNTARFEDGCLCGGSNATETINISMSDIINYYK